jgi:hypothetical protein
MEIKQIFPARDELRQVSSGAASFALVGVVPETAVTRNQRSAASIAIDRGKFRPAHVPWPTARLAVPTDETAWATSDEYVLFHVAASEAVLRGVKRLFRRRHDLSLQVADVRCKRVSAKRNHKM